MKRVKSVRSYTAKLEFSGSPSVSGVKREIDRFIVGCVNELPPGSIWRIMGQWESVAGDVVLVLEYEYDEDEPAYKDWVRKNAA